MSEKPVIVVSDSSVNVQSLVITRKEVADYLRELQEDERVNAFVKAVEVGVFCLERATASQDTEFVRRQIESLLNEVERKVGEIPQSTERALVAKIGMDQNQVLAPVKNLIDKVEATAKERIKEVRDLLQQDIDPTKETSSLGKALKSVRDLLDPDRKDSMQGRLEHAVNQIVSPNGELATAVKDAVREVVDPLKKEFNELAKEFRGQEAAQQIVDQTTLKGPVFEEEVLEVVKDWSRVSGAEVSHVGVDNKPGDVLVELKAHALAAEGLRIIVEAKDKQAPVGRKAVSDAMSTAMEARSANLGIYVCRDTTGFAKEIGDWAEGGVNRGAWIACTFSLFGVALRFAVVQRRLAALRAAQPEVDVGSVSTQVERIRTALATVKNIKTQLTVLRTSAQTIEDEADSMRKEIKEALDTIEDSIRIRASAPARALEIKKGSSGGKLCRANELDI